MRPFSLTVSMTRNHATSLIPLAGITSHPDATTFQAALTAATARWAALEPAGMALQASTGGDLTLGDLIANDAFADPVLRDILRIQGIMLHTEAASLCLTLDYDLRCVSGDEPPILAGLRNDATGVETGFDARPWFRQASPEELKELADIDFGGDYPADAVTRFIADTDAVLAAALDACTDGFEVYINARAARAWIAEHAPDLAENLLH